MNDDLTLAIARLAAWLEPRLRADEELRVVVSSLARGVGDWAASLGKAAETPPVITTPPPREPLAIPSSFAPRPPAASRFEPLTPAPALPDGERELELLPLDVVAERSRIKAEACRLVARRLAGPGEGRDTAAEAELMRRAAALPDCALWMLIREPVVVASRTWRDLAGAYSTAAEAALLLREWLQAPPPLAEKHALRVLSLAAEAQSVLLYAVADARDVKVDFDQVQLYAHIRTIARHRQVFIAKYLKREDRASPESWLDVLRRIAETADQFRKSGERDRARTKAVNNLRYKLTRLRESSESTPEEWSRVYELIDSLVSAGLPPSNAELRELLLPVIEEVPGDPPPPSNVQLVLREIDRYLDSLPESEPPLRAQHLSPEVEEVADLLEGREVVLIGGQARPLHRDALKRAFRLTDVRWLCTPEHTSFTVFEPDIARPEVALVILAIRWSSHGYDQVREYCDRYGKPLVRLPGGYNANQVAHHILMQAGDRLRTTGIASG